MASEGRRKKWFRRLLVYYESFHGSLHSSSAVGEEAAQDLDLQVGGRSRWRERVHER